MNFPIIFKIQAEANAGVSENWLSYAESDPEQAVFLAIPEDFKGPGGALSPEDLYGMAIANCFIATFKVIAEASHFTYEKVIAKLNLEAEKNDAGKLWIARGALHAIIYAPADPAKVERLFEKACENCLIMNSVLTSKTFSYEIA